MGFKLEGAENFRKALEALGKDCQQVQMQVVNEMANTCLATAARETPVGDYSKDLFIDTKNKRIKYTSFRKTDGDRVTFRVRHVKQGGTLRRGWRVVSGAFSKGKARSEVVNNVPYAGYVNDGHRTVNRQGVTTGWVMGRFMLERGIKAAEKMRDARFQQLIAEVKRDRGL